MHDHRSLPRVTVMSLVCLAMLAPAGALAETAIEWSQLHERWEQIMHELPAGGCAVAAVLADGSVHLDALGWCDAERTREVTVDSPFYIASSTKSFTALAICMLVEQGEVELDAPVRDYLPKFDLRDSEVAAAMTIRDLLAHRQGIDSGIIATGEAYTGEMTEERYYRLLALVKPSGKFQYSNLNFTLAGRVIQAVTGLTWQEFIARRILAPAGMEHSYCRASRLYGDPLAAFPMSLSPDGLVDSPLRKTDRTMHAAGGMGTSARDLAAWIALNLHGGRAAGEQIVSGEMLTEMHALQAEMEEPQTAASGFDRHGYGLGWFLGDYRDHRLVHHFGGYTGARAHVSFMPEKQIGVAVIVNTSGPGSALADIVAADIYDALLDLPRSDFADTALARAVAYRERLATATRPEIVPMTYPAGLTRPLDAYVGHYLDEEYGTARIEIEGDALVAHLGDYSPRLHSTGPDEFRGTFVPGSEFKGTFEIGTEGQVEAIVLTSLLERRRLPRQNERPPAP